MGAWHVVIFPSRVNAYIHAIAAANMRSSRTGLIAAHPVIEDIMSSLFSRLFGSRRTSKPFSWQPAVNLTDPRVTAALRTFW